MHLDRPTSKGTSLPAGFFAAALVLFLASCATDSRKILGPAPDVSRRDALEIAKIYHNLEWSPTEQNILHGRDSDGIMVQTPDAGLADHGHDCGWWEPGKVMVGMPYQWGGFDTPEQFLKSVQRGLAAGDIATREKRRLDDAGTSRYACGIDCSGFVSRCWRLDRPYSCDELPQISSPVRSWFDLKPGDILLKNSHVLLFRSWDPRRSGYVLAYEVAPNPKWRVNLGSTPIASLEKFGYAPRRYHQIHD